MLFLDIMTGARPNGLLAGLLLAGHCLTVQGDEIMADVTGGDGLYAQLRWRAEHVSQDGFDEDAFALPLRTRLGFESSAWHGLSFKVEYDYVFDFGLDHYDEGGGNTPDRGAYPVISDPSGGDLNQAWLQWESPHGQTLRAGRQRIVYDNARFIGDVGWRQNEQTFDAVGIEHGDSEGFLLKAAWLGEVHRIFGSDVPAGENDLDTWIANLGYHFDGGGKWVVYYYDIDNRDDATASTMTYGTRWLGDGWSLGEDSQLAYTLEYAHQADTANAPVNFSADYYRVDLTLSLSTPTFSLGYESLGGDDSRSGAAFRTPLATLHAFNGWADKFLSTPDAGLTDLFGGVKVPIGAWSLDVVGHRFDVQSGHGDLGHEFDASLSRRFAHDIELLFKAAYFDGKNPAYADTTKFWVQLSTNL